MSDSPYKMTLSLNVLEHLGLNLYSNVPAVLAEVVANSWDADAEVVEIVLDRKNERITITDDGHGMTLDDINDKYLHVGYRRRDKEDEKTTQKFERQVMGRKGIGKLSLFSIAKVIEVVSVRDGQKNGFRLSSEGIREAISSGTSQHGTYHPEPLPVTEIGIEKGTRIVITDLKKNLNKAETALRKRLARRFSVIGSKFHFSVLINGVPVGIQDRDYFSKVQYLWHFGKGSEEYVSLAKSNMSHENLDTMVSEECPVRGWIGTVKSAGDLRDEGESINNITLLVRGKLAQEDILDEFGEGGLYSKYIIGEVEADFLDSDEEEDIATSSRQRIREDDPRYEALSGFVGRVLKHIQSKWTSLRNKEGEDEARKIPAIDEWFKSLGSDSRKRAKSLFGKINEIPLEEGERKTLFKHAVLAFETFRYRDTLDELERVQADNIEGFLNAFRSLDEVEAMSYYQIVQERIRVIDRLKENVEENVLEKVLQQHLFEHLWLLDPGWERATGTANMEQSVAKEFDRLNSALGEDERRGRVDIKYRKVSGSHVIVELKRADPGRKYHSLDLERQVEKYRSGLRKCLDESNEDRHPVIDTVIVVGEWPTNFDDSASWEETERSLSQKRIKIVHYRQLLHNAYACYSRFLEKRADLGRLREIVDRIEVER